MESNYGDKEPVICGCATSGFPHEKELHQLAKDCPNIVFAGAILMRIKRWFCVIHGYII